MDLEFFEEYHQGGTYVIPVEVLNDFVEDYEKLKSELKPEKELKAYWHVCSDLKQRQIDKAVEYTRNVDFPDWFVTKDQYNEAFAYEMSHIREILKGED